MYVYTCGSKDRAAYLTRLALSMVLTLGGCGPSEALVLTPELETIQAHVFDAVCIECHHTGFAAGGLDLSNAASSLAGLAGVPATNPVAHENGWVRVEPGNPDLSFLMRKLRMPGVGEGAPMPPGEHELTDVYVELIADWIRNLGSEGTSS